MARTESRPFTEKWLSRLTYSPSGPNEYYGREENGLVIQVPKVGPIAFRLRQRSVGKHETIGYYHPQDFNLKAARERVEELSVEWRNAKAHPVITLEPPPSLRQLPERYADQRTKDALIQRARPLPKAWDRNVETFLEIYKDLLDVPVGTLTEQGLIDCQSAYAARRMKETGRDTPPLQNINSNFKTMRPMLEWAAKKGWLALGQIPDHPKGPQVGERGRKRFLLVGELQRVLTRLSRLPKDQGLFWELLLYTGGRRGMLMNMRTAYLKPYLIDADDGDQVEILVARTPPDEMKKGDLHLMPLVGRVRQIIIEMEAMREKDDPYVIPAKIRTPLQQIDDCQKAVHALTDTHHWHRHDCRRTHGTYLGFLDTGKILIRDSLGHKQPTDVTDTYVRSSEFLKLAESHVRLQALLNDIREGTITKEVRGIQNESQFNKHIDHFVNAFGIEPRDRFLMRDQAGTSQPQTERTVRVM